MKNEKDRHNNNIEPPGEPDSSASDDQRQQSAAAEAYRKQAPSGAPVDSRQEKADVAEEVELIEEDKLIRELESKAEELQDKFLRKAAELDNFRKRTRRDHYEAVHRAIVGLMENLIPVLDSFELAISADNDAKHDTKKDDYRRGVEMIYKQLYETLTRHGLEQISAAGQKFDPEVHEALQVLPTNEHEEGTIIEVLQKGYALNGRVVRPARVKVAAPAGETAGENAGNVQEEELEG